MGLTYTVMTKQKPVSKYLLDLTSMENLSQIERDGLRVTCAMRLTDTRGCKTIYALS